MKRHDGDVGGLKKKAILVWRDYWTASYHLKTIVNILQNKQKKKYVSKNEDENQK